MSDGQKGYAYRLHPLTFEALKDSIEQHLFLPPHAGEVFAFAGNTVDLQRISSARGMHDLQFEDKHRRYTFGHVFSARAELRWKRQQQHYDALLLTEQEMASLPALRDSPFAVRSPKNKKAWMVLNPRSGYGRLGYVEYVGQNEAVYFVRYTSCLE